MKQVVKKQVINLRKQGLTYNEILEVVPVAKSTLSLWLHEVGLTKSQHQRITLKKIEAAKRGGRKRFNERVLKTQRIKEKANKEARVRISDPLWLCGVMLYWAEGSKEKTWRPSGKVVLNNMDPLMIALFKRWLLKYCGI